MNRMRRALVAMLVLGTSVVFLRAQEAAHVTEMRFVNELRKRRLNDLALEYLLKLEKTASPALKKELPLEIAKTRLEAAGDEPDTNKRLAQYRETQAEFKKFLVENKNHPRTAEVKLDLARVLVLQGRTELSRAWLQESVEGRVAEGLKARATFLEAGTALQAASVEIGKALDIVKESTTAEDKALAKKYQEDYLQCDLEKGLNFIDQAQTFLDESKDIVLKERGQRVQQAQQILEKVAAVDDTSPLCWQAKAWSARCYHELGEPKKARQRFTEILGGGRQAAEGQRLARYFRLLVISEAPEPDDKNPPAIIMEAGKRWLVDYPSYRNTTEAYGLRYLLARTLLRETENPKTQAKQKTVYLADAKKLIHDITATENEYTDRGRQLTEVIVNKEGGFKKDIAQLTTFEDCFIRARYEIRQMSEDPKTIKNDKELEDQRKKRQANVMEALSLGLTKPDAKGKGSQDINTAKAILTFYYFNAGKYKEAIDVGETFARFDPRAAQAANAAIYALQSHSQALGERERKMASPDEMKADRDKMVALAHYMKERWPKETAGNLARHQLAILMMREKNIAECIKELVEIAKDYPGYIRSQILLVEACSQAEKDKLDPLPGDKADGYRTRAIAALETMPDLVAGADPMTNQMYMMSRVKLLQEWFKVKKYKEMDALSAKLLPLAGTLKVNDDPAKDTEMKDYFKKTMGDMQLYAFYGLAQAEFDAKNYQAVATLLEPLLTAAKANANHQVLKNQQLGNALLSMALRSDIQLGKLDQARQVIPLLQALSKEAGDAAAGTTILKQLVAIIQKQLEDMGKNKDEKAMAAMKTGFTAILDDLTKQEAKPTPEYTLLLAQVYATMNENKKAADLLDKVPEPKADDQQGKKVYQAVRLLYVRQLRLNGDYDKAKPILFDTIIGTKEKPGWGQRNIDALKERVLLLEADGNFAVAAQEANRLVQSLVKKASTDNALKEQYLECYYHVVYCFLKHGQNQVDPVKRAKFIKDAATQIIALEARWMGFGSEASTKRFQELLQKELELKQVYDDLKKATAPAAAGGG